MKSDISLKTDAFVTWPVQTLYIDDETNYLSPVYAPEHQEREFVMSEYETIKLDASPGGVVAILLDRPEQGNAIDGKMVRELTDAFENLRSEEQLRLVILRGAGEDFCIGADRRWFELAKDYSHHENEEEGYAFAEMLRRLHDLPQLTLALVQGNVLGGGAGLMAACDVVIAKEDTSFRFGEVSRGMIPATIAPYLMQAVGSRLAKALMLTGESFDAAYAEAVGLVQYVVEDEEGMESMLEYLSDLAFGNSPSAVADTKRLIRDLEGKEIDKDMSHLIAKRAASRWERGEAQEGIAALLEDRDPSWKG